MSPPAALPSGSTPWRQRRVLRESTMGFSIPVVATAAGTAYALVAKASTPMQGPWVLRRTDLRSLEDVVSKIEAPNCGGRSSAASPDRCKKPPL